MTSGEAEELAQPIGPDGEQRRWILAQWGSTAIVGVLLVVILQPFLSAFSLRGDDFSLVLNSAWPYISGGDVLRWFTEGYANYFNNYPDWPTQGYGFVRPVMNLAFWVQSFLVPSVGEVAYLIVNYLALLVSVALLVVAIRRYSNARPLTAAITAIAVGLSPVWYDALFLPSMGTNVLALAFCIGTLVMLDARRGVPTGRRMALCVTLMVLAVLSHETAVVMPLVCVALLYGMAPTRPEPRRLLPLAVPVAVVGTFRIAQAFAPVYVAPSTGSGEIVSRIKYFLLGPLFPTGALQADTVGGFTTSAEAVAFWTGLLVNLCAVAVFVWLVRQRPGARALWLTAAILIACVPGVLMSGQARFMGLSVVVGVVVIAYVASAAPQLRNVFVAVLVVSQVAWVAAGLVVGGTYQVAMVKAAGEFYDASEAALRQYEPSRVMLVNDRTGFGGARAMLKLAAWPRTDVEPIVINSFTGPPDPRAYVDISREGSTLRVESVFGPRQLYYFWGATPVFSEPVSGFYFSDVVTGPDGFGGGFRVQGESEPGSVLVLGVDPATNGMLSPEVY